MNNVFSERFRATRILNGFSLQDLAEELVSMNKAAALNNQSFVDFRKKITTVQ